MNTITERIDKMKARLTARGKEVDSIDTMKMEWIKVYPDENETQTPPIGSTVLLCFDDPETVKYNDSEEGGEFEGLDGHFHPALFLQDHYYLKRLSYPCVANEQPLVVSRYEPDRFMILEEAE